MYSPYLSFCPQQGLENTWHRPIPILRSLVLDSTTEDRLKCVWRWNILWIDSSSERVEVQLDFCPGYPSRPCLVNSEKKCDLSRQNFVLKMRPSWPRKKNIQIQEEGMVVGCLRSPRSLTYTRAVRCDLSSWECVLQGICVCVLVCVCVCVCQRERVFVTVLVDIWVGISFDSLVTKVTEGDTLGVFFFSG